MSTDEVQFDMIAVGDTTQDVFLRMSDASVQCDVDGRNCRLCLDYADKIAVDQKTDVPAVGNAANHAIGIARLGLRSAIYTVVGDDTQGHIAHDVFTSEGVDARYLAFDPQHGTNYSTVINFKSERTILVYHEPRQYRLPRLSRTRWTYLTSASGEGVRELHEQVLGWLAEEPSVQLAFNPGTHQIHLGREALLPLLQRAGILFLNREEAAEILNVKTRDIRELMMLYHDIGVQMMVITDGPDGAYVSDGEKIYFLGIFEGPVVERTGAGDSYGVGLMGALLKGKPVTEAMLWGNANSTSVVQYIGAREGLLGEEAVAELIAANPTVRPTVFAEV